MEAQRIGTLPPADLDAELARARKYDTLSNLCREMPLGLPGFHRIRPSPGCEQGAAQAATE
jgi:hypothetical protein